MLSRTLQGLLSRTPVASTGSWYVLESGQASGWSSRFRSQVNARPCPVRPTALQGTQSRRVVSHGRRKRRQTSVLARAVIALVRRVVAMARFVVRGTDHRAWPDASASAIPRFTGVRAKSVACRAWYRSGLPSQGSWVGWLVGSSWCHQLPRSWSTTYWSA